MVFVVVVFGLSLRCGRNISFDFKARTLSICSLRAGNIKALNDSMFCNVFGGKAHFLSVVVDLNPLWGHTKWSRWGLCHSIRDARIRRGKMVSLIHKRTRSTLHRDFSAIVYFPSDVTWKQTDEDATDPSHWFPAVCLQQILLWMYFLH